MDNLIGLDFETYAATSLPERGLYNYVNCPTFTPLIASIAVPGDDPWSVLPKELVTLDFTAGFDAAVAELARWLEGRLISAHNAGFERAVLARLGIDLPANRFVDSAVLARAAGAAGKLEAAAPQLLGTDKLEDGRRLIQLFSIPGKLQEENGSPVFDRRIVELHPDEWALFDEYCQLDASLSLQIANAYPVTPQELEYQAITMDMNTAGWRVDVATVEEMQRRYLENQAVTLQEFRANHDAHDLNLNSLKQLKEWCLERGIKATSFDEKNVAKLADRIRRKLDDFDANLGTKAKPGQYEGYCEVLALLETKQILGGSSLKKLQVILDTAGHDGRLRDQYLHVGAGQTWRTTGRSVQMQNLKRLTDEVADMSELQDLDSEWDNEKLAQNLRQVFTASHPQGRLVVGDFSSVESRGLAWLAGEQWKLDGYKHGNDMYKVLAAKIYDVDYYDVTKAQRQTGKVGELSCGYGAGGGAVQAFAENMGVTFTEGEANQLVTDWRAANPLIVKLWADLDQALHDVLERGGAAYATVNVGPTSAWRVRVFPAVTPSSLLNQHAAAQSIGVEVIQPDGRVFLTRVFHGCYLRGRNICYYKPSEKKSGDLWSSHFVDPKTKQVRFYTVYGGKLAGILTQSFCREIFFGVLKEVHAWVGAQDNVTLVGQFHDEIVLDWQPGTMSLDDTILAMKTLMSDNQGITGFPLEADIKHDYRYTK